MAKVNALTEMDHLIKETGKITNLMESVLRNMKMAHLSEEIL